MENMRSAADVEELLGSLQEGLKKAEETMTSILQGIVAENALIVSELEAALTDVEAVLANE